MRKTAGLHAMIKAGEIDPNLEELARERVTSF